jgi:hypothetical protein
MQPNIDLIPIYCNKNHLLPHRHDTIICISTMPCHLSSPSLSAPKHLTALFKIELALHLYYPRLASRKANAKRLRPIPSYLQSFGWRRKIRRRQKKKNRRKKRPPTPAHSLAVTPGNRKRGKGRGEPPPITPRRRYLQAVNREP